MVNKLILSISFLFIFQGGESWRERLPYTKEDTTFFFVDWRKQRKRSKNWKEKSPDWEICCRCMKICYLRFSCIEIVWGIFFVMFGRIFFVKFGGIFLVRFGGIFFVLFDATRWLFLRYFITCILLRDFRCYVLFHFLLYANLEAGAASKINPAIILFVSQLF